MVANAGWEHFKTEMVDIMPTISVALDTDKQQKTSYTFDWMLAIRYRMAHLKGIPSLNHKSCCLNAKP